VVLIGFASDEGVRRNGGRIGARHGPDAFRKQLAKLPYRLGASFADAGTVACQGEDLESAATRLESIVAKVIKTPGHLPLVIGGGHEVAWGTYLGVATKCRQDNQRLGIINFDAHFDLRDKINGKGHSGSAFLQIAQDRSSRGEPFDYLCLGIQPLSNHDQLFARAKSLGAQWVEGADLRSHEAQETIKSFLDKVDTVMLTICLDVLHQSVAPGVSAPQPLGIFPTELIQTARAILASHKVIALEVAELCPPYDGPVGIDGTQSLETARLAAACTATMLETAFPKNK
jgi:formiminoglutamase